MLAVTICHCISILTSFTLVSDFIVIQLQFIANLSFSLQFLHILIQSADISQINLPVSVHSPGHHPSLTPHCLQRKVKLLRLKWKALWSQTSFPTSFSITHHHISNASTKQSCLTSSIHYSIFRHLCALVYATSLPLTQCHSNPDQVQRPRWNAVCYKKPSPINPAGSHLALLWNWVVPPIYAFSSQVFLECWLYYISCTKSGKQWWRNWTWLLYLYEAVIR